jgi:hypothetical protein
MGRIVTPAEAAEMIARYAADLGHECPVAHCQAKRGEPCRSGVPQGKVHESRRMAALKVEATCIACGKLYQPHGLRTKCAQLQHPACRSCGKCLAGCDAAT